MGLFGGKKSNDTPKSADNEYHVGLGVYTLDKNFLKIRTENKKGEMIQENTINYSRIDGVTHSNAGLGMKAVEIRVAGEKKPPFGCAFAYKTKKNGEETERFINDLNKKLN